MLRVFIPRISSRVRDCGKDSSEFLKDRAARRRSASMKEVFSKIVGRTKAGVARLANWVQKVALSTLGRFSWSPPTWAQSGRSRFQKYHRAYPVRTATAI